MTKKTLNNIKFINLKGYLITFFYILFFIQEKEKKYIQFMCFSF